MVYDERVYRSMQSTLKLDPTAPLYQQIYEHLRASILNGQLKQGAKIPSSRALADELGISRNTVLSAYDQLLAEGYLESVAGQGTFVTRVLPERYLSTTPVRRKTLPKPRIIQPSQRAQAVLAAPNLEMPPEIHWNQRRAFRGGLPALDQFPFDLWAKIVARHAHRLHPGLMRYQESGGYRPLREAIADHVIVARQVHCTPDQVMIVNGSQGALDLAARVLLNPGDAAWIEDPGYLGARSALLAAGARLVPVPVDDDGLQVEMGVTRAPHARFVYVTPAHQFPLGVTMSLARRLALFEWANSADSYILEDDYDSEYRFIGRPLASLQGLDENERVFYMGTFSKVMFPALRLGYLIVPPAWVDVCRSMRRAVDAHTSILEQAAMTDFMTEGHFTRHIRRMRALYAERRAFMLQTASDLPLELFAPEVGMHLVGWLPEGIDDQEAAQRAAEQHIEVMAVSRFTLERPKRSGLMLGYGAVNEAEIREGVQRLSAALASL